MSNRAASSSRRIRYILSRGQQIVEPINDEDREAREEERVRVIQWICAPVRPGACTGQSDPHRASYGRSVILRGHHDKPFAYRLGWTSWIGCKHSSM